MVNIAGATRFERGLEQVGPHDTTVIDVPERDTAAEMALASFQAAVSRPIYNALRSDAEIKEALRQHEATFPRSPDFRSNWTAADDEALMAKQMTPEKMAIAKMHRKLGTEPA